MVNLWTLVKDESRFGMNSDWDPLSNPPLINQARDHNINQEENLWLLTAVLKWGLYRYLLSSLQNASKICFKNTISQNLVCLYEIVFSVNVGH